MLTLSLEICSAGNTRLARWYKAPELIAPLNFPFDFTGAEIFWFPC